MPAPHLTSKQIAQVSGLVGLYITAQREKYAPRAVSLSTRNGLSVQAEVADWLAEGKL